MKVIIAIVLTIYSVSALGSGPYLPSGWKPQGPSFYLPSEVAKPSDGPQKENLLQETEASGSEALREYGPPKFEQFVINQGLPDVATEQTYDETKANQEVAVEENVAVEASTEQATGIAEVVATATEAQLADIEIEDKTTEILSEVQPTFKTKADIIEETSEAVSKGDTEEVAQEIVFVPTAAAAQEEIVIPTAVAQEEIIVPTAVVEDVVVVPTAVVNEDIIVPIVVLEQIVVETVSEGVNNIAEAIVNLEKEVKAAEALEAAVEIKQEVSGSLEQAPEGFLEYGPPGYREYGPPKQEEIARSAAVEAAPASAFENNEVRRRRFSPKFRSDKKH